MIKLDMNNFITSCTLKINNLFSKIYLIYYFLDLNGLKIFINGVLRKLRILYLILQFFSLLVFSYLVLF